MKWRKLGLVFNASGQFPWMQTHAAYPLVENLPEEGRVRVFFATRDELNRSSIASLVLDLHNLTVDQLSTQPWLRPGELFDADGVTPGSLFTDADGLTYLYYLGWKIDGPRFSNSIGLALRRPGENVFTRNSSQPMLGVGGVDPLTLSYPWVMHTEWGWKMWYGSHESWETENFEMVHSLRCATSIDGLHWQRNAIPVLSLRFESGEFAMSRPCVIKHAGLYKMWFSHRAPGYRIGYAESEDCQHWFRSESNLSHSSSGWDSESVEYACVFEHNNRLYMLYNGNAYGRTGFGLAVAD